MMRLCGSELPAPKIMSSRDVDLQVPLLRGLAPYGALCWHDVVMLQPHKLVEVLTEECLRGPVTVLENRRVTGVSVASGMYEVQDASGSCHHARAVVSTLGPFLSSVALPGQLAGERPLWAKGFNVTISRQLEASFGVGVQGDSGRLFFCLPRGSGTAIGTWYVPWAAGSGPLSVSEEEIEDLVSAFNAALPGANVHRSEVASVDVGLLPMQSDSPQGPVLVANERIHAVGRYAEVLSTKYTIFRSQGRKALAAVSKGLV
jgi:glycerol-3-phosphate dehydrogenase